MTAGLRALFMEINRDLGSVLNSEETFRGGGYSPQQKLAVTEKIGKITAMFVEIESEVQKRLRYEEA